MRLAHISGKVFRLVSAGNLTIARGGNGKAVAVLQHPAYTAEQREHLIAAELNRKLSSHILF